MMIFPRPSPPRPRRAVPKSAASAAAAAAAAAGADTNTAAVLLRFVTVPLFFAIVGVAVDAMPMQVNVAQRATECIYETLNADEHITASAFILEGTELKATVQFDGPIAPVDVKTGAELKAQIDQFERHGKATGEVIRFSDTVDFEDLNLEDDDDIYSDDDDEFPDDDAALAALSPDQKRRYEAKKAERERKRELEKQNRGQKNAQRQKDRIRDEGDPFEKTFQAKSAGWYRFCVQGTWHQVVAEIDLRKESELGGLDDEGNVLTYEEKAWLEEEKLIEEDTAAEEGIKDEDFESTKEKLKTLRRLLADIQTKQLQERHRLIIHSQTNEHSHSRMVLGSLLETIVFMIVTGVQIMTIRRWFKGAPVLGR